MIYLGLPDWVATVRDKLRDLSLDLSGDSDDDLDQIDRVCAFLSLLEIDNESMPNPDVMIWPLDRVVLAWRRGRDLISISIPAQWVKTVNARCRVFQGGSLIFDRRVQVAMLRPILAKFVLGQKIK